LVRGTKRGDRRATCTGSNLAAIVGEVKLNACMVICKFSIRVAIGVLSLDAIIVDAVVWALKLEQVAVTGTEGIAHATGRN